MKTLQIRIPFTLEAGNIQAELVEVDVATQEKMDAIGRAWREVKR